MKDIEYFFTHLLGTDSWPPRWYCGIWSNFHGWLYIISDLMVWGAYFIIPFFLIAFIKKKEGVPFPSVFYLFGLFILLCGFTHLVDAAMFWWPAYRFSALVRFCTGVASWFTIGALFKYSPEIFALKTGKEFNAELAERRKVEKKLLDYTKKLEFTNVQLSDFCNIISHNLRGPLSNVSMLIDYIEHSKNPAQKQEMVLEIRPVINHLNEILNELLESIQISQDTEIKADKVDLQESFDQISKSYEMQIKSSNAHIRTDFTQAPIISFPQKYIDSIFSNLLSNSLKYQSAERVLTIKTGVKKQENNKVLLYFSDNGTGIDLELHRDKLFKIRKVFHKHPDAKGFGLYMIKTQIEAMGGKIWAESAPNKGCTFFIELNNQLVL